MYRHRLTITLLVLALAAPAVHAKLYKWVDDEGNVHYSDSVPPEHAKHGREVKSESGQTVEKVEPPPSKEELEAQRQREAERQAAEERAAEQRRKDRVLLMSYSNVAEIRETRDQRLETLESRIRVSEARIDKLQVELEKQRERAAELERSSRGSPEEAYQRVADLEQQIDQQRSFIRETRKEIERIREEFAAKIERFEELQAEGTTDGSGANSAASE